VNKPGAGRDHGEADDGGDDAAQGGIAGMVFGRCVIGCRHGEECPEDEKQTHGNQSDAEIEWAVASAHVAWCSYL
jgi:hypothetical protein